MARRQAITYKPSGRKQPSLADLRGKAHWHFCIDRECRLVYEDTCSELGVNGRCHLHRGSRRPIWVSARDPTGCCIGNCFMVTDPAELVRYGLAGPGPWFMCTKCARASGWPCN